MESPGPLPLESKILVTIGPPKYDRCLSDKILAAFNHAYAEGETGVAAVLRQALEEAERAFHLGAGNRQRRTGSAIEQADRWAAFVDARNAYRRIGEGAPPDAEEVEDAREDMVAAYMHWSQA